MSIYAVEFSGVEKSYPYFNLSDIELRIPHGTIMGFIGANGAGKSTTMRILMGLIRQDRGEVNVLGQPMPAEQARAKQNVGFFSEDIRLYKQATLAWHMNFIQSIYPQWDENYAKKLIRVFNLIPEQKLKGFSHGERVKAILLLLLARRPKLLVLDEPTSGLDPVARHEIIKELMEVLADEERTIIFSSHNTLDVERLSDQITFIDRGRIIDSQDKESFLDSWRRIRLEVSEDVTLPQVQGIIDVKRSGKLCVLTTNKYEQAQELALKEAGATLLAVENMTLEEIFVANVLHSRGDAS